jgi:hypothetical protein
MRWLVAGLVLAGAMAVGAALAAAAEPKPKGIPDDLIQKIKDALPDKAQAAPAKPRRLLVYTRASGYYHGSIPILAKALELMGEKTGAFTTVVTDDPAMITPEKLKDFDAVFMNSTTGNCFAPKGSKDAAAQEIEKTAKDALLEFVKGGKGLAGNHAATDCYYGWKEYGDLIGGYFAGHPYSKITVKIDDPASPVNAAFGGQPFQITDEMYIFKDPYSREKLHILLSIDNEKSGIDPAKGKRPDGDYAISWIQNYGQGRVFYCSFGHQTPIFTNAPIMRHFLDGIQFAFGDLKADATPTAKLAK